MPQKNAWETRKRRREIAKKAWRTRKARKPAVGFFTKGKGRKRKVVPITAKAMLRGKSVSTTTWTKRQKYVWDLSGQLYGRLAPFCEKIVVAGSIRRLQPPTDIDFVVIPKDRAKLEQVLIDLSNNTILMKGNRIIRAKIRGVQVDVYMADRENFGAMLMTYTGPAGSNIGLRTIAKKKGMKLNQYGLWKAGKLLASEREEDIYHALGRSWKSPQLRGN